MKHNFVSQCPWSDSVKLEHSQKAVRQLDKQLLAVLKQKITVAIIFSNFEGINENMNGLWRITSRHNGMQIVALEILERDERLSTRLM